MGHVDHPAEVEPEVIDDALPPRLVAVIARQPPLVVEHGLDLGPEHRPIFGRPRAAIAERGARQAPPSRLKVRSRDACSSGPRSSAGACFRWAYERSSRNSLCPVQRMNRSGW